MRWILLSALTLDNGSHTPGPQKKSLLLKTKLKLQQKGFEHNPGCTHCKGPLLKGSPNIEICK